MISVQNENRMKRIKHQHNCTLPEHFVKNAKIKQIFEDRMNEQLNIIKLSQSKQTEAR